MSSRTRIVQVDQTGRVVSDVSISSFDEAITVTDQADVFEVTKDIAAQEGRVVGRTLDATLESTLGVTRRAPAEEPAPVTRRRR